MAISQNYRLQSNFRSAFKAQASDPFKKAVIKDSAYSKPNPKNEGWFELFRAGVYDSREFFASPTNLQQMVDNFNAEANLKPVYIDHVDANMLGGMTEHPTAGWIRGLAKAPSTKDPKIPSLWGYLEFDDQTASLLRDGKFLYCSIFCELNSVDRVSNAPIGYYLLSLAICNQPFILDLAPIRLAASKDEKKGQKPKVVYLLETEELKNMANAAEQKTEDQPKAEEQSLAVDDDIAALDLPGAQDDLQRMVVAIRSLAQDDSLNLEDGLAWLETQVGAEPAPAPAQTAEAKAEANAMTKTVDALQLELKATKEEVAKLSAANAKHQEKEVDALLDEYDFKDEEAKQSFREIALSNRAVFNKQIKAISKKEKIVLSNNKPVNNASNTEDEKSVITDDEFSQKVLSYSIYGKK